MDLNNLTKKWFESSLREMIAIEKVPNFKAGNLFKARIALQYGYNAMTREEKWEKIDDSKKKKCHGFYIPDNQYEKCSNPASFSSNYDILLYPKSYYQDTKYIKFCERCLDHYELSTRNDPKLDLEGENVYGFLDWIEKRSFPLEKLFSHHPEFLRKMVFFISDIKTLGNALVSSPLFYRSLCEGDSKLLFDKFLIEKKETVPFEKEECTLTYYVDSEGKKQGTYRLCSSQGRILHEKIYKNGVEKKSTRWNKKGSLYSERTILEGQGYTGKMLVKMWRKDGTLSQEYFLVRGRREGVAKKWRNDGTLSSERNHVNGKLEGLQKHWSSDGILHKTYFVKGVRIKTSRRRILKERSKKERLKKENILV